MKSLEMEILRHLHRDGPLGVNALATACDASAAEVRRAIRRLESEQLVLARDNRNAEPAIRIDASAIQISTPSFDFLDAERIRSELRSGTRELNIEVVDSCPSTNSSLLEESDVYRPRLLVTEEQTAGRGRRGRRWLSGLGNALTVSLRREVHRPLRELPTLSLVAGVAAARALCRFGADSVRLKWPNDLVVTEPGGDAKLGGILVETRQQGLRVAAVIGIGINLRNSRKVQGTLRRRVIALEQLIDPLPSRNQLVGALANEFCEALDAFEARGFASAQGEWETMHAHAGRRLRIRLAGGRVLAGIAEGLDEHGGLRLRTPRGLHAVHSGRVVNARAS